jgi:AcrR family transcriptional regulator
MRTTNRTHGRTFIEAARRAQIVRSAIETIADLGFTNASLAEIARRAGISKSVISYHFESKEELVEQVVAQVFEEAVSMVVPRLQAEPTAAGKVRAYIEARVGHLATHREQMAALFHIWTSFRTQDGKLRLDETTAEPTLQAIEEILRLGQAQGEFREFSTRVMAVAIRQAIDGVVLQSMVNPQLDLDLFARELAGLFDRAMRRTTE